MMKRLLIAICLMMAGTAGTVDYSMGTEVASPTEFFLAGDSSVKLDTVTSPAYTGTLDSVICWANPYTETRSLQFVIYKASDSTLLDSTARFTTGDGSAYVRYKANFVKNATIAASTRYFIGFFYVQPATGDHHVRVGTSAVVTRWWYSASSLTTLPATFTTAGGGNTNITQIDMVIYYHDATGASHKIGNAKFGNAKI